MVHNNEKLRPCPMLENPELLPKMVAQSGAHSTELEAPESAEHLCEKCKAYAACWKPEAEKLWAEEKHNGWRRGHDAPKGGAVSRKSVGIG